MHSKTAGSAVVRHANVACPFCGLVCDDLTVRATGTALQVEANGCPRAKAGFERRLPDTTPRIAGQPATLAEAVTRAAAILRKSRQPLFGGLATDVAGMRAVMDLADRTGGIVDHMAGDAILRNVRALQDSGWVTTTLSEVRNRADLLVFAGVNPARTQRRFFDRCILNKDSLFSSRPRKRELVFLGRGLDARAVEVPNCTVETIPADIDRLGEIAYALQALIAGRSPRARIVGGAKLKDLAQLAERMKKATYGVLVWAPGALDYAHADLTVQAFGDLLKALNQTARFAGLPLGGDDGAITAMAVSAWQSGYPLRTSFARGYPEHDPIRHTVRHGLASGEADALVWVTSFTAGKVPPRTSLPTIVLGEPGLDLDPAPTVFIPVGTPGVDHGGQLVRVDSVVSLPLRKLRDSDLPSTAKVLHDVLQAL